MFVANLHRYRRLSVSEIATELTRLLGPLRREMSRATRAAEDLPDIPEAQIELLRVLVASGPVNTRDAAIALRIARPTVSNLVKAMTAAGLVERASTGDLRSAILVATPHARDMLYRFDRTSTATVAAAIDMLSPAEQDVLASAIPVLNRLRDLFEHAARPAPSASDASGDPLRT
ncbi:MarR family transcriptional regulator [Cryobacterium sp. MDB2-10]|nr:MarR family transcriptional regulator [Cryobacterium sp. MDB2-A-1]TFC07820.1 MarR family transcriptional regulator [Cryobacterium sp. MDB2-A-2]TFC11432.1 MarR family transcriptional regulator [Cryobacterium sp. MDB2-33-2]TFC21053.1 MarR family transcriptional regulator [Cryobacterium sp. MDB2-10]